MAEITDILAMYGRIDQIAGEYGDDPRVEATIERLLPGTAGYQQGWYGQVERFLQSVAEVDSSPLPDYPSALASLANAEAGNQWRVPQQAKARYTATVLAELHGFLGGEGALTEEDELGALSGVLAVGSTRVDAGETFLALIDQEPPSHSGWHAFMTRAEQEALVTSDEARLEPPARGKIRAQGDEFCTQLDTPYEDPLLDISKVRAIIDPRNWPGCCPYWKQVTEVASPVNPAGWTRIYEVVQAKTDAFDVQLTTPLIFRNHDAGGGVVVNYDLDTDLRGTQHDDYVLADSGYIWATPLNPAQNPSGVRVHTRKVARIQGLGVAALAMYAYAMGWSTAGENLILGCAKDPPKKAIPFKASQPAKATTPNLAPRVPPIPKVSERDRKNLVDKVVGVATKAINDRSTKGGDLAQRWFDGELMPTDVVAGSADAATDAARSHTTLHNAAAQIFPSPEESATTGGPASVKKAAAKKKPPKLGKKAVAKKIPPKKAPGPKKKHI
jgi:hypothetical protein